MADDEWMTTEQVAEHLGYTGGGRLNSAWRWLLRRGIKAESRQPGSTGQNLYSRTKVLGAERNMRGRRVDLVQPETAGDADS